MRPCFVLSSEFSFFARCWHHLCPAEGEGERLDAFVGDGVVVEQQRAERACVREDRICEALGTDARDLIAACCSTTAPSASVLVLCTSKASNEAPGADARDVVVA